MNWKALDVKFTLNRWIVFLSLSVLIGHSAYRFLDVSFVLSLVITGIVATIIHFYFYFKDKVKGKNHS